MQIVDGNRLQLGKILHLHDDKIWIDDVWLTTFNDNLDLKLKWKNSNTQVFSSNVWDIKDYKLKDYMVYTRSFFYRQVYEHSKFKNIYVTNVETKVPLSFSIGKNHWPRILFAKLIELFNFQQFNYTAKVQGQILNSKIIDWLSQDSKFMLPSIKEFLKTPVQILNNQVFNESITSESVKTIDIDYIHPKNFIEIMQKIYTQSAVALVTETGNYPQTIFTEKSIHPVCALNFQIWPVGWKMVEHWRNLGFDMFDDIIDNSYDKYPNMFDRCYCSLLDNYKLLTDLEYARELRLKSYHRLTKNREFLLSNQFYQNYIDSVKNGNYIDEAKQKTLNFIHAN